MKKPENIDSKDREEILQDIPLSVWAIFFGVLQTATIFAVNYEYPVSIGLINIPIDFFAFFYVIIQGSATLLVNLPSFITLSVAGYAMLIIGVYKICVAFFQDLFSIISTIIALSLVWFGIFWVVHKIKVKMF